FPCYRQLLALHSFPTRRSSDLTAAKQVTRIDPKTGEVKVMDTGINKPNGIALSNDGGTLAVSDYGGTHTWTFRMNKNGVLDAKIDRKSTRLNSSHSQNSYAVFC